jgi:dihydroneopterin aldolase
VREVVEREPLDYLETVAGDVATGSLALAPVASVRVAVRKPHVALDGPLAYAEIVVERHRG